MKHLLARVFGSIAFAAYLMHVGQRLLVGTDGDVPALGWAGVALLLVVAVAASWALARLNAKRAALWTAFVLLGLVPVGAWVYHRAPLDAPGGYGILLLLCLLFGLATLGMTGWLLADRRGAS